MGADHCSLQSNFTDLGLCRRRGPASRKQPFPLQKQKKKLPPLVMEREMPGVGGLGSDEFKGASQKSCLVLRAPRPGGTVIDTCGKIVRRTRASFGLFSAGRKPLHAASASSRCTCVGRC